MTDIKDMPHVTVEQVLALRKAAMQLQAENEKLIEALDGLIWNAANNTGKEPSLSCFYLALIEAKKALEQAKGK